MQQTDINNFPLAWSLISELALSIMPFLHIIHTIVNDIKNSVFNLQKLPYIIVTLSGKTERKIEMRDRNEK